MESKKELPEFTYNEWHYLWRAVEARATQLWSYVEKYQIEKDDTGLWVHFLELAEAETALLNKVELMANAHFPVTNTEPFPPSEPWPNPSGQDLDKILIPQ